MSQECFPSIDEDARKLDRWLKFETAVFICNYKKCCACAAGVLLDLWQIHAVCQNMGEVDRATIISYVLAHEKAHCLQARTYGGWDVLLQQSKLYELQADYIAGAWIGVNLLTKDLNHLDIAKAAFAVGGNTLAATHPTGEHRMKAVIEGLRSAALILHAQSAGGCIQDGRPIDEGIVVDELLASALKYASEIQ